MPADPIHPYVSRGGLKLRHALDHFALDVTGLRCADLGASTGGFTDCLLQAGAAHVISVDTAYGQFAWKLRNDPRVTLLERSNALHVAPGSVDLVVMDLGWTPQRLAIPVALRWLTPTGRIISLIKPHYELGPDESRQLLREGVLADEDAGQVVERVLASMPSLGASVLGCTRSPIQGSKERSRGNPEWLMLANKRMPSA